MNFFKENLLNQIPLRTNSSNLKPGPSLKKVKG